MAWRREALPNRRLHTSPSAFLVSFWASKKKLAAGAAKYPAKRERTARRVVAPYKSASKESREKRGRAATWGRPYKGKGKEVLARRRNIPAKRERTARRGRRALQSGSLTAPQGIGYNEFGDKNTGRLVVRPRAALPSVTLPPGSSVLHIIWIWEESEYGAE